MGPDDFLTKPVDERELVARIQTSLKLKQAMDRRIGELSRVKDHFEKFVPETVKKLVADNPDDPGLVGKREQDVSVLFLDISGYTRLSEQLPAAELNALVEHYFSTFLDHIHEAGGDIRYGAGGFNPFRRFERYALDLHRQRPGDQSGSAPGRDSPGGTDPGGTGDGGAPGREIPTGSIGTGALEECGRGGGNSRRSGAS